MGKLARALALYGGKGKGSVLQFAVHIVEYNLGSQLDEDDDTLRNSTYSKDELQSCKIFAAEGRGRHAAL